MSRLSTEELETLLLESDCTCGRAGENASHTNACLFVVQLRTKLCLEYHAIEVAREVIALRKAASRVRAAFNAWHKTPHWGGPEFDAFLAAISALEPGDG